MYQINTSNKTLTQYTLIYINNTTTLHQLFCDIFCILLNNTLFEKTLNQ